ncbi:MAG: aminopeptidase [Flavobacteriaceae bacterium]|nr:aminopeptidase [Flavobacteriaceae bacterium]
MRKFLVFTLILSFLFIDISSAQNNEITINATLDAENHELKIQQEIIFHNNTNIVLNTIYLHNWANGYRDKKTPLSKRLIENYNRDLHFSKEKFRGFSDVKNISINYSSVKWKTKENAIDIIEISLKNNLKPKDSIVISATYMVKIPSNRFTKYGRNKNAYDLRYWYLVPAFYDQDWELMSNLDMDDLLMELSNYNITFTVPSNYTLNSDLASTITNNGNEKTYHLTKKNRVDIELNINKENDFEVFNTDNISVETNLNSKKLSAGVKIDILNREIAFIERHLGKYPHKKIFVNKITYSKNPVYGLNQLPSFLRPFSDVFEWDIKMFKALTEKYLNNTIIVNRRKDSWFLDGLQTYLMMEYVEEYYPEMKATGNLSKIWGLRKFNLTQLNFNDKYPILYQFAARKNVDQPLTMSADSLSNFNRKIINKYKAGLGLRYLNEFLKEDVIPSAAKQFFEENTLKFTKSSQFKKIVLSKTDKDLSWFFGDYIKSKRKIDYTISNIKILEDSVAVTIKNKRNISAPVALYGVKGEEIHFKRWITGVDSTKTVVIPKNGFNKLSLNYEYLYPELNLRDNWKNLEKKIFNRPLQLKFLRDVENPHYNQLYYTPIYKYNFYDGLQLGVSLGNKTILNKNFTYKISPYYGTKSKGFVGSFSALYKYIPKKESSKIDKYYFGVSGSSFHYAPQLTYRSFSPYVAVEFKRKSLRDVGGSSIYINYVNIKRDLDPTAIDQNLEANKYSVFNIGYSYSKPNIIQDLRYTANLELANKFSKATVDFRYRILTDKNRQFDFRFFAGAFLNNKTTSDYFSFGLSKQSDYLFRLDYLGRSEGTGFLSQQYITNEGGFKSFLPQNYANQWLTTFNTSIGIWRWAEIYNDVGFLKNKGERVYFAYENGIRLNFIHEILEVHFPVYSNLGWEVNQPNYSSKIRFVLTVNPVKIINFVRRGYY